MSSTCTRFHDLPVHVVIVDADPLVRAQVTAALSAWSRIGTIRAVSPDTLDDCVRREEFELIVLDSGASDAASLPLLQYLKSARPDVPVMMISRHGDEQWAVHAIQAGAVDFIPIARVGELLVRGAERSVESARLARELHALKTDLIGMVSHDIRAPAGNILGYIDLLLAPNNGQRTPARERDYFLRIQENGRFILRLVGDLLDMARIESGGVQLTLGHHDIGALAAESVERCTFFARSKSVELVAYPPGRPETATVDRAKIVQVLSNLIANAVKFSHEGSSVSLSVHVADRIVAFRVEDRGVGIAMADVDHLFKKFSPVSSRGTRGERGSGLGLYIVQQFVGLHHGSVRVESEPGKGSVFTVTVPQDRTLRAERPGSPR